MKRVLVVDDSGFQRTLVRDALADGYEVVGEASNGTEAVDTFERLSPDVVTMDVTMPETNGIEATARIRDRNPETTILMITSVERREQMKEGFERARTATSRSRSTAKNCVTRSTRRVELRWILPLP